MVDKLRVHRKRMGHLFGLAWPRHSQHYKACGLQVLSFLCPAELLSEDHIVLEACQDGAWSNPLVLPLLAAEPPDNLDSYLAASPAEERQELEHRLAGVLGEFHSSHVCG